MNVNNSLRTHDNHVTGDVKECLEEQNEQDNEEEQE